MILLSAIFAFTASNTVSVSGMDDESHSITANQLKPSACSGLDLDTIITNGSGTTGNDLVLGTADGDTLNGGDGNDCLVAGDGVDTCTGGAGTDVFLGCETINDP